VGEASTLTSFTVLTVGADLRSARGSRVWGKVHHPTERIKTVPETDDTQYRKGDLWAGRATILCVPPVTVR
jgi:hypothetical protein